MTETPSHPSRRRPVVIAGMTIALLATGLVWHNWPRIDPRLVGEWSKLEHDAQWPSCWVFNADGTLHDVVWIYVPIHSHFGEWRVSGDSLHVTSGTTGWRRPIENIRLWLRGKPLLSSRTYRIIDVSSTVLRVQQVSSGQPGKVRSFRRGLIPPGQAAVSELSSTR